MLSMHILLPNSPILKILGQFENLGFVIMSTRENIRLIARAPLQGYGCLRPVAGLLSKFGSFACNWKCDACGIATFVTAYSRGDNLRHNIDLVNT